MSQQMLVLVRRVGDKVFIGDDIIITVVETHSGSVKLGFEAPNDVRIMRGELKNREKDFS